MSITPTGRNPTEEIPSIPGEKNASPLQNVKLPLDLLTDSSIMSLAAVSTIYHDQKNYQGEAGQPKLPIPLDGNNPPPVEPAVQNIVSGFISKQITMLLADVKSPEHRSDLYNSLTQGTPLQNPQLAKKEAQIRNSLENSVRQEMRLENFTLDALYQPKKEAWIQNPVSEYSPQQKVEIEAFFVTSKPIALQALLTANPEFATAQQKILLNTAINGGMVDPKITPLLAEVNNKAIAMTQTEYGLSTSWKPGTTDSDKWKPINKGLLTPQSIGIARQTLLEQNSNEVSINYLDAIIDALYEQRKYLNEKLLMTAEMNLVNAEFKKQDVEQRHDLMLDQVEETEKANRRSNFMNIATKVLMGVGIAISVVSMALTILSAGLLSPLAVAAIAVTAGVLTYTVVDATTGVTAMAFEAFNEWFGEVTSDLSTVGAAAAKLALVVTVVAIVAILAIASSGSAGTAVGSVAIKELTAATTKAMIQQGASLAARQLAIQVCTITLLSSGVLLEFPTAILAETGLSDKQQKLAVLLIFFAEVLAVMLASAAAVNSMMNKVNAVPTPSNVQADEIAAGVSESQSSLKAITSSMNKFNEIAEKYLPLEELRAILEKNLVKFNSIFRVLNLLTPAANSVMQSVVNGMLYHTYKKQGDLALAEEELKAMITFLDSVIEQLQNTSSAASESSTGVAQLITGILNSVRASTNKVFSSYQG